MTSKVYTIFHKTLSLGMIIFLMVLVMKAQSQTEANKVSPNQQQSSLRVPLLSKEDTISYAFGAVQAANLRAQGFLNFKFNAFFQGFIDTYDSSLVLPLNNVAGIVSQVYSFLKQQRDSMNKVINQEFMRQNKLKDNIGILPSGIQYEILKKGEGLRPTIKSEITVNYKGYLINNVMVDSTAKDNPSTFLLEGVIKGWQEVIQLMNKGSKWRVYIPSDLAYGEAGQGNIIPPYSALIFEIELVDFKTK